MNIQLILFYVFSTVLIASSVAVVTLRNPVHAVLSLVLAFVNGGALWLLAEAEFLGIALILVYVGAVMVLFLFVVMLLDIDIQRLREGFWRYLPAALIVAALFFIEMALALHAGFEQAKLTLAGENINNVKEVAKLLYTEYLFPLELAAVLLLIAMIAAIALTLRKKTGRKVQAPAEQVSVKRKDRVRILSLPSQKR